MKVIALSASPSRGRNSDSMLNAFLEGVCEYKDIQVRKLYLEDIPIKTYGYENRKGPEGDEVEFAKLCDSIRVADGLVIATPTYNFSVPAHLKNFIDRIRFFALDFEKKTGLGQPVGKLGRLRCYFLVSGGTPSWAQRILFFAFPPFWLRGVFLYYGANVMGGFYSGDVKSFENKRCLAKCKKEGRRYARKLLRGSRQGILEQIFWRPPEVD